MVFEYNDSYKDLKDWHLCIKTQLSLSVTMYKNPDSEALFQVKGRNKAWVEESKIFFSKLHIFYTLLRDLEERNSFTSQVVNEGNSQFKEGNESLLNEIKRLGCTCDYVPVYIGKGDDS